MIKPKRIRTLICGGRDFTDLEFVMKTLFAYQDAHGVILDTIIHGCASGADRCAEKWARARAKTILRFPAHWEVHGRGAGPVRNQQMIDEGKPALVIAFPGGVGTEDMKRRAKAAGIPVIEISK